MLREVMGMEKHTAVNVPGPGMETSERRFVGVQKHVVDACLALISALVIYWTVNVTADVVIKRALYLMLTMVLSAIAYPFSRRKPLNRVSWIDLAVAGLAVVGSFYVMYDYNSRFIRLSTLNKYDIFLGVIMLLIGLDLGRRVIGWALTLVASGTIFYAYFGKYIPGNFGHPGFDIATIVSQVYCGLEGYYGMATKFMTR